MSAYIGDKYYIIYKNNIYKPKSYYKKLGSYK